VRGPGVGVGGRDVGEEGIGEAGGEVGATGAQADKRINISKEKQSIFISISFVITCYN
jgi:hypothetical protein